MPQIVRQHSRSAVVVALLAVAAGLLAVQAVESQPAPTRTVAKGNLPWAI